MLTTADPAGRAGTAAPARWTFASTAQRRIAVVAAVLAFVSVVITVNAARAHPDRQIRRITTAAPPAAVTVDATGCPVTARCHVQQRAIGLDAAFARAFPSGQVLDVQATVDLDNYRSYRSSLIGLVDATSIVSLSSQCVPGAPASQPRLDRSSTAFVDLAGNSVVEYRQLNVLVPGGPGCGVALLLRTRGAAYRYQAAALRLARDPASQLPS